ncbi:hypothetical protein DLAC_10215 [Tieghemostelium lacteum]|uniref:Uncharacterized protein n=1 Tax=Tieghemostelium lacteum TaxID=361077 RepID=A0A151Z4V0_TIELA|nr:hypothetical protein DLAC_10215 [Tieghemostelium lacteum]|eukprot:KYQ88999.1 hypothetical protein DLAC_10215 [Tieghemostelium lacteum]
MLKEEMDFNEAYSELEIKNKSLAQPFEIENRDLREALFECSITPSTVDTSTQTVDSADGIPEEVMDVVEDDNCVGNVSVEETVVTVEEEEKEVEETPLEFTSETVVDMAQYNSKDDENSGIIFNETVEISAEMNNGYSGEFCLVRESGCRIKNGDIHHLEMANTSW